MHRLTDLTHKDNGRIPSFSPCMTQVHEYYITLWITTITHILSLHIQVTRLEHKDIGKIPSLHNVSVKSVHNHMGYYIKTRYA